MKYLRTEIGRMWERWLKVKGVRCEGVWRAGKMLLLFSLGERFLELVTGRLITLVNHGAVGVVDYPQSICLFL